METLRIHRALISVSDKSGLAEFARSLVQNGIEIFSTGGTRQALTGAGIDARDVSRYTGFPEMMEGRVKTLHPKIFGGILCRHDHAEDMQSVAEHEIATFELVVVNLYPFEATIARPGVTREEAIENIDIGGPSLVRAAAKNHAFVAIISSPDQYAEVLAEIATHGGTTRSLRERLAAAAFAHTAAYDRAIVDYFGRDSQSADGERFPLNLQLSLSGRQQLRYGENPHQRAAVYRLGRDSSPSLVTAHQLHGKELSYNNLLDLDNALAIVRSLDRPAACVIKHNNPCGAAAAADLATAAQKALDGDPLSAFGSVLGFNRQVDVATAEVLAAPGLFIEAIAAPGFTPEAISVLTTKPRWKANVRLVDVGKLDRSPADISFRQIEGGMLVQDADVAEDPESEWQVATHSQPPSGVQDDLRFGWNLVRHVKSNAIVMVKDGALVGCGAGQMSRVDSVDIAIAKAGGRAAGAVLASDAFFPFPDSIHKAANAGIVAIIQPGGSVKDPEVIAACNEHNIPMIVTGRRHFRH